MLRLKFIFIAYGCPVAPAVFVKKYYSYSIELLSLLCQKLVNCPCTDNSLLCSIDLCAYPTTNNTQSYLL